MYDEKFLRRTWAEVDLNQIVENVKIYVDSRNRKTKIIAVVKADAYGHGDVKVAEALSKSGVDMFAVSNIYEAITLRGAGIGGEILVLGYTPVECAELLRRYDITQTLISYDYALALYKQNSERIKCHVAIDTGMNRIGLDSSNVELCVQQISECCSMFDVRGMFTHLCVADSSSEKDKCFTRSQIKAFRSIAKATENLNIKCVHCLNSAGGVSCTEIEDELSKTVRLGIIMYGLKPSSDFNMPKGIKSALSWKTVVSMIKDVKPGETIGYGRSYVAQKSIKVATLPVGYADGYNRLLSNKGYVLINGKKAHIIGRICMDQMMVNVSDIDDVSVGDEVVLLGKSCNFQFTADDMASLIDTIGYEIVCDISKRVPRIYLQG